MISHKYALEVEFVAVHAGAGRGGVFVAHVVEEGLP